MLPPVAIECDANQSVMNRNRAILSQTVPLGRLHHSLRPPRVLFRPCIPQVQCKEPRGRLT
jgi:hypothetical protein